MEETVFPHRFRKSIFRAKSAFCQTWLLKKCDFLLLCADFFYDVWQLVDWHNFLLYFQVMGTDFFSHFWEFSISTLKIGKTEIRKNGNFPPCRCPLQQHERYGMNTLCWESEGDSTDLSCIKRSKTVDADNYIECDGPGKSLFPIECCDVKKSIVKGIKPIKSGMQWCMKCILPLLPI